MWLMAFGSAIHKRSSCMQAPTIPVKNTRHWRVSDKWRDVPRKGRSNERCSQNSRGTSSLLPQLLQLGDTIGVLESFHIEYYQPLRGGERAGLTLCGHTENPRWVLRSWY